jgi:hypothetical protein
VRGLGIGIGIGKIMQPLGGPTEDVAWLHHKYPQVLKRLAKHPHFAEHGRNAEILADFYICGFMRGRQLSDNEMATFGAYNRNRRKPKRK